MALRDFLQRFTTKRTPEIRVADVQQASNACVAAVMHESTTTD